MSYLEYVSGRTVERGVDWVVIDVQGVGYRIGVTPATAAGAAIDGEIKLWTYLHVREDVRAIYGFPTPAERAAFVQLIGVSGVGPQVAMAALSGMGVERLARAIEAGDAATLARLPRLGPKTAQRIILDLKGKLRADFDGASADGAEGVIDGLVGLGLTRSEAVAALAKVEPDPARSEAESLMLALQAHGARGER